MKITVRIDEQSFDVEVGDLNSRPIQATIDGKIYEVWPEVTNQQPYQPSQTPPQPIRQPIQQTNSQPIPTPCTDASKILNAPLPGVIIAVLVKTGDSVTAGQELVTLEAMKMKNAIRATRSGQIGSVLVSAGDQVKHGQPLLEYAE